MKKEENIPEFQKALINQIDNLQITGKIVSKISEEYIKFTKMVIEIVKPYVTDLINEFNKYSPYFKELGEAIEKTKKDPNSFINWSDYSKKLSSYFWVFPYKFKTSSLKEILENVDSEEKFDEYMKKHFSNDLVDELINDIKQNIPSKYKIIFNQIEKAYNTKSFALANTGMMTIIDGMCSFYIVNKKNLRRINLFKPIAYDCSIKEKDWNVIFILLMLNNSINILYDDIDFNANVKIDSHKKSRRHLSGHGVAYSNKKIDSIMLLNLIYNMLLINKNFKSYKNSLIWNSEKQFYIASSKEKKEILKKIKNNNQNSGDINGK